MIPNSAQTIAAVRVGLLDGELLINPTYDERRRGQLDLVVAGSKTALVMVEAGAKEVSEVEMLRAPASTAPSDAPVLLLFRLLVVRSGVKSCIQAK